MLLVVGLIAALLATFATLATSSTSAQAAPGNPGVPSAATTVFAEDFENGPGTAPQSLSAYTGAGGEKYTAAPLWLANCNGQIVNFSIPSTTLGNCQIEEDSAHLRQLAYAIGAHTGSADPAANDVVAAYTENNPGANSVEFQTVGNIPLASASGRFLTLSVDTAVQNCAASAPQYQFSFLDQAGAATNVGGVMNACTSSQAVAVPANGSLPAGNVNVGTYTSNGSVLFNGSSLGIRMTNANGTGAGNDAAFDNVKILDVTPQLDKAFSPTTIVTGGTSTLTFTVTNTSELAAKNGWSFTDNLPAGVTLASPTAAATTCPSGAVTANAGGTTVSGTGNLSAGMASCTVTVNVTSNTAGSYTNGPGNVAEVGLNPPGDTTLIVNAPVVTCTTDPVIFNTGYNAATGGQAADGAADQRWTVAGGFDGLNHVTTTTGPTGPSPAALPPAGTTYAPAYVGKINNLWVSSQSGKSQWISADYVPPANGINQSTGYGDWYYRYQFNLDPAVDPSSFKLDMTWLADNSVAGVWVNNLAQTGANLPQSPNAPYIGGGFLAGGAATTSLAGNWQTGLNTILVQVKSYYVAEGFSAEVRSTALCPQPAYTVTKSASATTVHPGGTITYSVTVKNTGNVDYTAANPASFTDNLSGVLDDAVYNGDASNGATVSGSTLSWSGALTVGASTTVTYSVTVKDPDNGDHNLANAVTPGGEGTCDPAGSCVTNTPVQSFSVTKSADSTEVVAGSTITYTLTVTNTGEAAYTAANPASLTDDLSAVLDDATYNGDATSGASYTAPVLSWSGALAVGQTIAVSYSVTVNDPDTGDQLLGNAVVTTNGGDCPTGTDNPACRVDIPSGSFTVAKTASTTAAGVGDVVTYTVTVTNTGAADYTSAKPASFADDLSNVLDDATYNGDATGGATITATTLRWSGPLAIGASTTIVYSVTVNSPDAGNHSLANFVRPTSPGGDCVTGECATVTPIRSFTVAKSSSAGGTVAAGDVVTYTVKLTNTGLADYTPLAPASFTDDLSKVLDDATYNGDATGGATVSGSTLSWSGPVVAGASVDITYSVTVKAAGSGDGVLTNAVVPGNGGECTTAAQCETTNELLAFTVAKTSSAAGSVAAGDVVTYTVTVTNTGAADYTVVAPATFTDDLSKVLDDAAYDGDATGGATVSGSTLSWSGALVAGDAVDVTYSVTVKAAGSGDGVLTNAVVPGGGGECVTIGECETVNELRAFTVAKTSSATQVNPGDTVTYTVVVTNTGKVAYTAIAPASFTDDLTAVLDDATYNDDASNGASVTGATLSWSGAVAVGGRVTVAYSVTVKDPDNGDHSLKNVVTPNGPDGGCDPAGDCVTTTLVQSYTATKTADTNEVVPGGAVTYTVALTNTGQVDYTAADPATFTDDLSGLLDDATYNGDASNGATYAAPSLSWSGALAVGATQTITYSVTVNDPDTGDSVLPNTVVTGTGGNCAVGSNDPACNVLIPSGSFTVAKSASSTTVAQGGTVTYTVTVTNTGAIDYTAADPASFSDDLSAVLDDASYNADASNGATVTGTTLSWSGALAAGASTTITYSVSVMGADVGDKVLNNFVRPTSPGGGCATADGCTTSTPVRALDVSKTVDSTGTAPGKTLRYTITVKNIGAADYTAAVPASFTDDLSAVLDDATYNNDASNGARYAAPSLSWSGALAMGVTATVTYSVTVNKPDNGDHVLKNTVVALGSDCVAGSDGTDCTTTTKVSYPSDPALAVTGTAGWAMPVGVGGLMAILAGLGIAFLRRRRTA